MHQSNYQKLFYPEYWRQLALDERVRLLQDLENDQASQSERAPYTIKPVDMPTLGNCGELNPVDRTIVVNAAHIQQDQMQFAAIHTVLHEGRHAYQRAAVENRITHQDRAQVQIWKENAAVYVENTEKMFLVYRNQPIERDAEEYSNNELNKVIDRLEQVHGKIALCQRYTTILKIEARYVAEKTRATYGDDFTAKIDKAIRQAYAKTKALNGNKSNERKASAMEETVNFDVTIEKNGLKMQATIEVNPFHDFRNPPGEFDSHSYGAEYLFGRKTLEENGKLREDLIKRVEDQVFERALEGFGKDLRGLEVNIRPNYHSLINDERLVADQVDALKEWNEPGNVPTHVDFERERIDAAQSILYHKNKNAAYYPGLEQVEIKPMPNPMIKEAVEYPIHLLDDTERAVHCAVSNIRDTIKGFEAVHDKSLNAEPYFIIVNRPGKEPLAKTVAVDKNISQGELTEFLKKEASGFINEHVRNTDDLNGMSVRAEKANDLSSDDQREFFRQIGSLSAEKCFENSMEITR